MEKTSRFSALMSVNVPMECSNNALHSPKNQTQEDSRNLGHGTYHSIPPAPNCPCAEYNHSCSVYGNEESGSYAIEQDIDERESLALVVA